MNPFAAKNTLSAAEVLVLNGKLLSKSRRTVRESIEKIALIPPLMPLDGATLAIFGTGVELHFGSVDTSRVDIGFKIALPIGFGLQARHLVSALRGESGSALATVVHIIRLGQRLGTGFIQDNRNDLADLFDAVVTDILVRIPAAAA